MAYGKIKADAIIRDNSGSDEEITMASIVGLDSGKAPKASPTFTGTVTVPDVTATGDITLNAQQELRLADSDSSNYIALKAPATVGSNVTLTFPNTDGNADQYLQTNGSGVLSWADVAGGYTWASQITFDGDDTWSNIPTTVTEIVLLLDELKTTSGNIRFQLGTSSAFTTSGYISFRAYLQSSTPNTARFTNGFTMYAGNHSHTGIITLKRNSANNKWHMSGVQTMDDGSTTYLHLMAGRVDMGSDALEQVNVVSTGSGTYSGTISLGYK